MLEDDERVYYRIMRVLLDELKNTFFWSSALSTVASFISSVSKWYMNDCRTVDFQFPLEELQVFDLFEQDLLYLFLRPIVGEHCGNFQARWIRSDVSS